MGVKRNDSILFLVGLFLSALITGGIELYHYVNGVSFLNSSHGIGTSRNSSYRVLNTQGKASVQFGKKDNPARCMSRALSLKTKHWSSEYVKTMKCIENRSKGIVGMTLASHEDVDYAILHDVYYSPEDEILDISDSSMFNYVKEHFPFLKTETGKKHLFFTYLQWNDPNPWMLLVPSNDSFLTISLLFAVLNTQLYPQYYPEMNSLLLPSFDKTLMQGFETLIPVIASMRSEAGHVLSVKFKSDLAQTNKKWIYFPSLVLLGSIHRGGIGGLVQHVYDSHLYRAAIYKHYHIVDLQNYRRDKLIQIYYITRLNQSDPEQRINKNALDYVHMKLRGMSTIQHYQIKATTTRELISEAMKIDVLLGVSGPVMTLSLFLLPQSAVLEILPKGKKHAVYNNMAVGFDLIYYSHHQLETSIFEKDAGDGYEAYIDRFTLWQYLLDLRNTVQHNKYHCIVS